MCGICGIFSFKNKPIKNLKKKISQMTSLLRHRGPDQEGVFISDDNLCALGNTRLAIVDPNCRISLPIKSSDNRNIITFNGEIYNHNSLRKFLKEKGCDFRTKTDTEVLLNGLILENVSFFSKLDGMWAFGFYNQKKKELILSRDLLGERQLFFSIKDGIVYFASEPLPIIYQLKNTNLEIDNDSVVTAMFFNASSPEKTLIKEINKLKPGYNLIFEAKKNPKEILFNKLHPEKWLDFYLENPRHDEVFKKFNEIATESFQLRVPNEVPYISSLSGGLDSAIIAMYLTNFGEKKIDTIFLKDFGSVYDNYDISLLNERESAKLSSKKLGTKHEIIQYNHEENKKIFLNESEKAFDCMFDCSFIVYRTLANAMKKRKKKVIFMSDGLDEVLGYPTDNESFRKNEFFKKNKFLLSFFKLLSKNKNLKIILRHIGLKRFIFQNPNFGLFNFLPIHSLGEKDFLSKVVKKSTLKDFNLSYGTIDPIYDDLIDDLDYTQKMALSYCSKSLPDWFNLRSDKGFFGSSIECRLPFQDPKLIEFLIAAPASYRFLNGTDKVFARKIVNDNISPEVAKRKKYGMPFYYKNLNKYEKKLNIQDTLRNSEILNNFPFTKNIKKNILNIKVGFQKFHWTLYCLTRTIDKLKNIKNTNLNL